MWRRCPGVCICVGATATQVAPLCISHSSHQCVSVFCTAATTTSDTLNQLPPPTPTIHPRTHMWALVNLMPLGQTRCTEFKETLIGTYCNSHRNMFRLLSGSFSCAAGLWTWCCFAKGETVFFVVLQQHHRASELTVNLLINQLRSSVRQN